MTTANRHPSFTPSFSDRDETGAGWRPTVIAAIRRSFREDGIASIEARNPAEAEAIFEALTEIDWIEVEDDVRNGASIEVRGLDEEADEWRISIRLPEED